MAEGNTSDGLYKSRSVLGDVTNRLGKRGFSEREKNGVKSYNFNDKDMVKHIRVSPRPCSEINSLKGNLILRISNIQDGGKDPNVLDLESDCAVSNCSVDVKTDLTYGCGVGEGLKGKNLAIYDEEFHGGIKDFKILELSERDAVPQSVNAMDAINNDSVNTPGDILYSEDEATTRMDKMGSQNYYQDPNLRDLEGGRVVNSVDTRAHGCGSCDKFVLLKDNVMLGTPNAVTEIKCLNLTGTVRSNVFDLPRNSFGDVAMSNTKISNKNNNLNLLDLGKGNALQCVNIEANYKLDDSIPADTSSTVSETGSDCLRDGNNCDVEEAKVSVEGTQKNINDYQNDVDDYNADNLVMSRSGSIDCTILPKSQESRIFGVEKSTEPKKGDECSYFSEGVDSIKACFCSFCTKAAYIWLDLNYQDIKARVSAMKKSQKEARLLSEKICRSKATEKHDAESSTRISKLKFDLMHHWSFLFQHMAYIWEEEGSCLEASLLPLTDLREKCKTNLELINAMPSEKQ